MLYISKHLNFLLLDSGICGYTDHYFTLRLHLPWQILKEPTPTTPTLGVEPISNAN